MVSRREILVAGGAGLAALRLGLTSARAADIGGARSTSPLFLYDSSIDGADGVARIVVRSGITATAFRNDIGMLWIDGGAPSSQHAARPIAGITYGGALFCLDHLARSHGLACAFLSPLAAVPDVAGAVRSLLTTLSPVPRKPIHDAFGDTPMLWLLQPTA